MMLQNRRKFLRDCVIRTTLGVTGTTSLLLAPKPVLAGIDTSVLKSGDLIFGRRNSNDDPAWGFWRHVGIYDGRNVIEGGMGNTNTKVTVTGLSSFLKRYEVLMVMRLKYNPTYYGPKMASFAYSYYVAENRSAWCSAVVLRAFEKTLSLNRKWKTPDNIAVAPDFKQVAWSG